MTRKVVIVQARMSSTRLPGKVLKDLAGSSFLWHALSRCALIPGIDEVCCAVPEGAGQDPVAEEAARSGAVVVRGPEDDVLERYRLAAKKTKADVVMRVTSDCPLIDPQVCGDVLAALGPDVHYAANNFVRAYPHGLDCETFTRDLLEQAAREATEPAQREHVTPWMRTTPGISRGSVEGPDAKYARYRWTLDYAEDMEFFRALFAACPEMHERPPWLRVVELIEANSRLKAINAMHAAV